jgi:hypothetical protein
MVLKVSKRGASNLVVELTWRRLRQNAQLAKVEDGHGADLRRRSKILALVVSTSDHCPTTADFETVARPSADQRLTRVRTLAQNPNGSERVLTPFCLGCLPPLSRISLGRFLGQDADGLCRFITTPQG